MHKTFFWQLFLLNLTLAGCTLGPRYEQPPEMNIPDKWHSCSSEEIDLGDPESFVWWESLNDPILNSLIQRAAQQNRDLYIAGTRILEVRRQKKGKNADLYPHVDASLTAGHLYYSKDALVNGILGTVLPAPHRRSIKRNVDFFEIGFDATWEIDLFGATKHQINALEAKAEAAEEALCDIWITLSAEVARHYIELRSLQQRQQLLLLKIEAQRDILSLSQDLLTIGVLDQLELLRAEEQLNQLIAQSPLFSISIDKNIHRLSILLGQPPGELYSELCEAQTLPLLPCERPLGLPSELVRRRPDIRRAERNLSAATELVGSAVAALFPRFSLLGFIGDISTQLASLLSGNSGTWFAAPQLLLPIFNSKMLTQDVDLSKIQTQQALFQYQKTVLEALEEVENAIASFSYSLERNNFILQAQKANQQTYELTEQLYEKGLKDYLAVELAKISLLTSQDTSIQSQTELLLYYISLYKALGGAWDLSSASQGHFDCSLEKD